MGLMYVCIWILPRGVEGFPELTPSLKAWILPFKTPLGCDLDKDILQDREGSAVASGRSVDERRVESASRVRVHITQG